ncbi:bifunctional hydroxymethylpyrimidine kinase/phosphomethylpyrimidine kinase [Palleronia pelagia]|uniref:hydroxymethylpyrimidine kinase n=1 Tax=Palleronia pelagia TaxID=387096 RepID=A0A1H8B031_9RHOB|nr:bifunctional hydroxymethylpyrimidine kinase/phosphomethylpyrimidine kinase [Palleronia pelagia]SEM75408.1 hydroxymethylpyrimidine kinase /phosphomethylpyrimidine kinase [Palleronia pelagia]
MTRKIPNVLSIAGSDPSGGAGIQADLKAISANGAYAMAALTALTAQNTQGVSGIHPVPPEFVAAQIDAVFDDIAVDAVKVGMICNAGIAARVADRLRARAAERIVLDPVMIAKGGAPLLEPDAVRVVRDDLLPLALMLTPNLPEAAHLLDRGVARTESEVEAQGRALLALGPRYVLMKGGHGQGADSADCLVSADGAVWSRAPRIDTANTHGTGCSLSSALAAQLARGLSPAEAFRAAKDFVTAAIRAADRLDVGQGHGPTHHFATLWDAAGA